MVDYMIRGLSWGEEGTFGVRATSWNVFNYALDFDATSTETLIEEDILSDAPDEYLRADAQREITGRFEVDLMSIRFLKYVLGSAPPTADIAAPYRHTVSVGTTIPSFTIRRILRDPQNTAYYEGCKVDTARLALEVGEDVTLEVDFAASWSTIETTALSPQAIDLSLTPFVFYHGRVTRGGTVISDLQSCEIELANNLEARWSADSSLSKPRAAYQLNPRGRRVRGRFTCGETVEPIIADVISGATFDLVLELAKGSETIQVTVRNCRLTEWSDTVRGREIYEVEFPFLAYPTTGFDVAEAVQITPTASFTGLKT